ncbi:MAG TPA: response regulator [Syntrophobacteraceae bacterium]|nr:response regulator [Syntrophobacteraceae bacterium]
MKIKVLLVDDEKEFTDTLAQRLEIRDFEVTTASSADEALAQLGKREVDVVVLDVLMPGKDGVAALHEIKKVHPLVEVILLTGHATVESAVEGLKSGAFDYLLKPTETKDLIAKIVQAYRRKADQEERIRQAHIDSIMLRRGWD